MCFVGLYCCMFVCMYARMRVFFVYLHVCMVDVRCFVCLRACSYVCLPVCMLVGVNACM